MQIDLEKEKKEIIKQYRDLLIDCKPFANKSDKKLIRIAFDMALDAHKDMRRKSGEPYIYHPISVARIVAKEIGLGTTSVICALLHDVVEDTEITLEDIELEFGKNVAKIIDGLTKIPDLSGKSISQQADNFKKMLLTLADDVRVILIKFADRLHNMRTLGSMAKEKQLKIASETIFLYAPLAHRLGLYNLKSEFEDLSLKYTEPQVYKSIAKKLNESKEKRNRFIRDFIKPIKETLEKNNFKFDIKGRPKSISSIYAKMKMQNIEFEDVYDLFAVRIILDSENESEKSDCWRVFSMITDHYYPHPNRLRDWITTPKTNGYESLHTTVMTNKGQWVEVQIRTKRMDEVAEKGLAAHWKYKDPNQDDSFDNWLNKVRDILSDSSYNALEFVDDFKLNLYSKDVFVFTPTGDLKKLPAGSTILDFAYEIHTDIGMHCIGAKINHKIVPINTIIESGDQIEILSSESQLPETEWINIAFTHKAKSRIKQYFKDKSKAEVDAGKALFILALKEEKIKLKEEDTNKLIHHFKCNTISDFYYLYKAGKIKIDEVKVVLDDLYVVKNAITNEITESNLAEIVSSKSFEKDNFLIIDEHLSKLNYSLADCCNPIPGDEIFSFSTNNEGIKVHRTNCQNAPGLLSKYGYRIIKSKWTQNDEISFLAGIKLSGIDRFGMVQDITSVISNDFKINMRSFDIRSNDGVFEGTIMIYARDTGHLDTLIKNLRKIDGIMRAFRQESE